jgi:hypothetical protein
MTVSAATAGTALAATGAWFALSRSSSTKSVERSAAETASAEEVIVCVASDSVLRARADDECPAGQVKVALSTVAEFREFSDPWNPRPSSPPEPRSRFDDLERRLAKLEKAALFEVVDKRGRLVFRVARDSASVHNGSGTSVAELRATADGGFAAARSADGVLESFVGASGERAGIRIVEAGGTRVDLGKKAAGNHTLTFPDETGAPLAGIGESRAGTGLIVIGDDAGRFRASMSVVDGGRGSVSIINSIDFPVLSLTRGDTDGGAFLITDNQGEPVVKMNTNGRYGAALTGPAGIPLITGSGLPGSFILGCSGGPSCRPF